jgi:iron-sulfur cluster assembly protein
MTQATQSQTRGIQLTDAAQRQILSLRQTQGQDLCLRVGVRQGGCSGMSYMMDFESLSNIKPEDEVFDYDGFKVVCDRRSILYLYGLVLDYSNAMIGGGFQFTNPNASQTCGCGKSFSAWSHHRQPQSVFLPRWGNCLRPILTCEFNRNNRYLSISPQAGPRLPLSFLSILQTVNYIISG